MTLGRAQIRKFFKLPLVALRMGLVALAGILLPQKEAELPLELGGGARKHLLHLLDVVVALAKDDVVGELAVLDDGLVGRLAGLELGEKLLTALLVAQLGA